MPKKREYSVIYTLNIDNYSSYQEVKQIVQRLDVSPAEKERALNLAKQKFHDERRKLIIHGREYLVTFSELRDEFPDATPQLLKRMWKDMKKEVKR